jgi:hypothetical protein
MLEPRKQIQTFLVKHPPKIGAEKLFKIEKVT